MTITALYVVRDEMEFLPLSIATIFDGVNEIVIVNNRSVDGTLEYAQTLSKHQGKPVVKVVNMDTIFDESCEFNVRNESLKHCTGDWILALDGDQLLSDGWREKVVPMLENTNCEAIGVRYEHHVGSYEYVDKGLYEKGVNADPIWCFFRRTPHLQCRPAADVCAWAKEQHHASFERSCKSGSLFKTRDITLFHYGFAKRNMMEMSAYRIHRGDYGHDPARKKLLTAELLESGNPFKFIGPVQRVDYGAEFVPSVMRERFGKTYLLELDSAGQIVSRKLATGELHWYQV